MSSRYQRAELISTIVIIGFFVSVAFHYAMHFYYQRPYPYSTFLSWPFDHQSDFTHVYAAVRGRDPYHFHDGIVGNYFPFTYFVAFFFGHLPHGLVLFLALFLAGLAAYFYRQSGLGQDPQISRPARVRLLFSLTVMSYPVLFELDRANFEALMFLLIAACGYLIGQRRFGLSTLPLALAIAMKGYPAIFLGLYWPVKRYREAAIAAALSVVVCVICFSILRGGLVGSIHGFDHGLRTFQDYYVIQGAGGSGVRMNSSLFAPLGLWNHDPAFIKKALVYYDGFALLGVAGIAWLISAKKTAGRLAGWKLEYLLSAAALLLPFISYDYKLLVLFIPLASFLNSAKRERADAFYCASFGAMLIPKDYLFINNGIGVSIGNGVSIASGVSISSLLEPLILLATVAVIVREALARGADEGNTEMTSNENIREEGKEANHVGSRTVGDHPILP